MIERILVADDEPLMRNFAAETLRRLGKEVVTASDGEEAKKRLEQENFDLVLTDRTMPGLGGLDVMKIAKSLHPNCFVIQMTAFGGIEAAVEAMRLGAFNYLLKPFSPEALEAVIDQCEEQSRLKRENHYLREGSALPLIAQSPIMKRILQDIEKIAKSQASVFITGESGTGKEVISDAIHRLSTRSSHPFIKVNCAAVPETLIESEFFGHEKGAFTGAQGKKIGRFELADRGTLLLDEVTEIPLSLQPKLLRAIQELEFERVGGTRPIRVNVRLVATSNRNMQDAIEGKIFREDLFYRLNVIPIHLPALRERQEDIAPLANYFLERFCVENHKPLKKLTDAAIKKLMAYHWPGNVRELANIIERSVVLDFDDKTIDSDHLYLETTVSQNAKGPMTLYEVEKRHILEMLEKCHQNRTQTAQCLAISIRTLRNKLQEYGEAPQ